MFEIIAIIVLSVITFPVAIPALLIAAATAFGFWQAYALAWAAAILIGVNAKG